MSTKLQTRREYLVGLGLAKAGRGKFSNSAKEALAKADAEGYEFLDGPSPTGSSGRTVKSTVKEKTAKTAPVDASNTPFLFPDEYRFPEAEYRGITFRDGKKVEVSLRECCNTCMVSLVNHMCDSPTILGGITVKIGAR